MRLDPSGEDHRGERLATAAVREKRPSRAECQQTRVIQPVGANTQPRPRVVRAAKRKKSADSFRLAVLSCARQAFVC